jgi:hypothetical protein
MCRRALQPSPRADGWTAERLGARIRPPVGTSLPRHRRAEGWSRARASCKQASRKPCHHVNSAHVVRRPGQRSEPMVGRTGVAARRRPPLRRGPLPVGPPAVRPRRPRLGGGVHLARPAAERQDDPCQAPDRRARRGRTRPLGARVWRSPAAPAVAAGIRSGTAPLPAGASLGLAARPGHVWAPLVRYPMGAETVPTVEPMPAPPQIMLLGASVPERGSRWCPGWWPIAQRARRGARWVCAPARGSRAT